MELTINFLNALGHIFVLGAGIDNLIQQIQDFVGPIVVAAVGFMSVRYLFKREFMQFIIYLAMAVAVFLVFYGADIFAHLGEQAADANKGLSWQ